MVENDVISATPTWVWLHQYLMSRSTTPPSRLCELLGKETKHSVEILKPLRRKEVFACLCFMVVLRQKQPILILAR